MSAGTDAGAPESARDLTDARLPETERRLHRALLEAVIATGAVPNENDLAISLGIELGTLRKAVQALARADYLAKDDMGHITCLYPFSTAPTSHVVVIDGARRFAMCSLDALGVAAMLGRPVEIESSCAACGEPIRMAVQPAAVAGVEPPEAAVVAKRASDAPAVEACCAFTVFACGPAHTDTVLARIPDSSTLDLATALAQGAVLFADLLGEMLPANRSRVRSGTTGGRPRDRVGRPDRPADPSRR